MMTRKNQKINIFLQSLLERGLDQECCQVRCFRWGANGARFGGKIAIQERKGELLDLSIVTHIWR